MFKTEVNTAALDRALSDAARNQLPFATARALTTTGRGAAEVEKSRMSTLLDRPTPFTLRGIYAYGATKARPVAEVGIKRIQAQYLGRLASGGTRRADGEPIPVPVGARLNKYGNIPKRSTARMLARADVFEGTVKGISGIWQRPRSRGGQLKLLVRYEQSVDYSAMYNFQEIALEHVRRNFPQELANSLRQALATAR
jgi:hypothetical protein